MWSKKGKGCLEAKEGGRTLGTDLDPEVRRIWNEESRKRMVLLSHGKIWWRKKGENLRPDPNQFD